jgi:polyisoprenoid-binding protein YceI
VHATTPLPEDATVRHIIDCRQSNFVVQVFATGLLSAFGHNPRIAIRDFEGEVEFSQSGAALTGGRMNLNIHSDTLEVIDEFSQKDREEIHRRMREQVLETDRFPSIVYECTRVSASGSDSRYWAALSGELTLHGTTRATPVTARVSLNGNFLRASGDFSLRQSDYEITLATAAAGTIRVKDELKFTFDIVAHRLE